MHSFVIFDDRKCLLPHLPEMSCNPRQSRSLHFTSPEMSCNSRQSKSRSHYHCSIWSTAKCRTPIFYGPRTKDIGPSWPEPGKEFSSLGILINCCCYINRQGELGGYSNCSRAARLPENSPSLSRALVQLDAGGEGRGRAELVRKASRRTCERSAELRPFRQHRVRHSVLRAGA